jgi:hypothetical protein
LACALEENAGIRAIHVEPICHSASWKWVLDVSGVERWTVQECFVSRRMLREDALMQFEGILPG